ncbi:kinase-like protein [Byssothecium circinans]|uniref:Kinase-like protein n=1 Tax=Byssothecium circinans TaxID=147558 RepID=A0A6A5UAX9_9PLEO|nr:kinase-like protein [Byssothecium circinans]
MAAPPPQHDYATQRMIEWARLYDQNDEEIRRSEALPGWLREDYRFFCIGYKTARREFQVENDETWTAWLASTEDDRLATIQAGIHNPDPRLLDRNFVLGGNPQVSEALRRQRSNAVRTRLIDYIIGCRVEYPDWDDDVILRQWSRGYRTERLIRTGRIFYDRYQNRVERGISYDQDHDYILHGMDGIFTTHEPTRQDLMHMGAFMNIISGEVGDWVYERTLSIKPGRTTSRVVHLISRVVDNTVVTRVAVKIHGAEDMDTLDAANEREFRLQHLLTEQADLIGIGDCEIARLYGIVTRFRLGSGMHLGYGYMEFCRSGTLAELIRNKGAQQFPELFIWLVFRNLAKAILIMQAGILMPDHEPLFNLRVANHLIPTRDQGWFPLVNLDIKPSNVCLTGRNVVYPAFEVAKMIDFGDTVRAIVGNDGTYPNLPKNWGTEGWRAPEAQTGQHQFADAILTSQASIFSTALVILSLIEGREILYDPNMPITNLSPTYNNAYSTQLVDLVFDCLAPNPDERPSLMEVLYETKEGIRRWQQANGDMTGVRLDDTAEAWRMRFEREEIPLGHQLPPDWMAGKRRALDIESEDELEEGNDNDGEDDDGGHNIGGGSDDDDEGDDDDEEFDDDGGDDHNGGSDDDDVLDEKIEFLDDELEFDGEDIFGGELGFEAGHRFFDDDEESDDEAADDDIWD